QRIIPLKQVGQPGFVGHRVIPPTVFSLFYVIRRMKRNACFHYFQKFFALCRMNQQTGILWREKDPSTSLSGAQAESKDLFFSANCR
ncbi:MAG: hypothetical protein IJU12_10930, partial [Clostridia bacterium]|nr:hypothetical protein [Clostridia bacterium]